MKWMKYSYTLCNQEEPIIETGGFVTSLLSEMKPFLWCNPPLTFRLLWMSTKPLETVGKRENV